MRRRLPIVILLLVGVAALPARANELGDLDSRIAALGFGEPDVKLGIEIAVEGQGVIYSRAPEEPRAAASAIKSAILLDLFLSMGDQLDQVPPGAEALLGFHGHPAFAGFSREELDRAQTQLAGRTYLELARIMMGRTDAGNDVYNAACNLIMVKLGGPGAITRRLVALDPGLAGIDINRYMEAWNGNGDNRATPEALVTLYRMALSGHVPGLDPAHMTLWRSLLLEEGDGGPGSRYEKLGTLYPEPMVRVHAGYQLREQGSVIYAVMGEIPTFPGGNDPAQRFVRLMNAVDTLTTTCLDLVPGGR